MALLFGLLLALPALGVFASIVFRDTYDDLEVVPWAHIVFENEGEGRPLFVLFISDAWGVPVPHHPVEIVEEGNESSRVLLASDQNGFLRHPLLVGPVYLISVRHRQFEHSYRIGPEDIYDEVEGQDQSEQQYDIVFSQFDLDFDRSRNSQVFHVVRKIGGSPATDIRAWLNETFIGSVDDRGYIRIELPGPSRIVLKNDTTTVLDFYTTPGQSSGALPRRQGPSFVYAYLWSTFAPVLISLLSLPVALEAISSERALGTLDLLRTRPIPRYSLALGKLAGCIISILAPLIVSAGLIAVVSSWAFPGIVPAMTVVGFLGGATLLVSFFILLVLVVSLLIKNPSNVIIIVLAIWAVLAFGAGQFAAVFELSAAANPFQGSTDLFSYALPSKVVFAHDVLFSRSPPTVFLLGTGIWMAALLGAYLGFWYLPQFMRLMGLHRRKLPRNQR